MSDRKRVLAFCAELGATLVDERAPDSWVQCIEVFAPDGAVFASNGSSALCAQYGMESIPKSEAWSYLLDELAYGTEPQEVA